MLEVRGNIWCGPSHRLIAAREKYSIDFYASRVLIDALADVLPRGKLAQLRPGLQAV